MTCTGRKADGSPCGEYQSPLRVVTVWCNPGAFRMYGVTEHLQQHHLCSACIARLADDLGVEAYMVHPREA